MKPFHSKQRACVSAAHLKWSRCCIVKECIALCDMFISPKQLLITQEQWDAVKIPQRSAPLQNKMKIKSEEILFISSSRRKRHRKSGLALKINLKTLNNVFDVLYLNLYAYLHYSYFPGLGTNPFDMEMGRCVSWQGWEERERERQNFQVRFDWKCAENRFSESFAFMVLVIGDYTNHLKCKQWAAFIRQTKSPSCWTHSPHSRG